MITPDPDTGQGNKFSDKQKKLPARPVGKLIYFCNLKAVCKSDLHKNIKYIVDTD